MSNGVANRQKPLKPASVDQLRQQEVSARVDGLRGMSWAYGVLLHTGYTASGASKRFSPPVPEGGEQSNSKLMYQYLRGERAPTLGARGRYGFDLVAAVDAHPQGRRANRWLDHPLWMVFDKDTTIQELYPLTNDEREFPPLLTEFTLYPKMPPPEGFDERQLKALELQIFADFVWVCAVFRLGRMEGYGAKGCIPPTYPLLEYLVPQAGKLEPVFGLVQAPFLKMIRDFYF